MIEQASYELFCRGRLPDPYPVYRWLREHDPVHWSVGFNGWVLTRYQDVLTALRDPRLQSFGRIESYMRRLPPAEWNARQELYRHYLTWMVNLDPPDHTRLRTLVNKAFTPRVVESLADYIERSAGELLDGVADMGEIEIVSQFACPLPAMVIAKMLGVPPDERDQFQAWSKEISAFTGTGQPQADKAQAAHRSMDAMLEYVRRIAEERKRQPRDDLLSVLVKVEEQGDRLSEHELAGMCVFLLVAGHETTTGLIANGVLSLLNHPEELARLKSDPALATSAVEEILRYEAPLQHQVRIAREDFTLAGRSVKRGQRVVVFLGSANRDPEQFDAPDRLDIRRANNRHLSFGYGAHFCVGAPLARLEGRIAFNVLLNRYATLRLARDRIDWRHDTSMRQPATLFVDV